jgi:hypothetical protein
MAIFLAAMAGLVGLAVVVNKVTGTKQQFLEDLVLAPGERELWRGDGCDAYVVAGPQPLVQSFARLGRHRIILTTERLLWGQPALFGKKHVLERAVLFRREGPGGAGLERLDGGFYGSGVIVHLADPKALKPVPGGKPGECDWVPLPTVSSTNVRSFRLFVKGVDGLLAALGQLTANEATTSA